jgi:DNA polymerase
MVQEIIAQELIYREINRRGIPVDLQAVAGAVEIRDVEMERLLGELKAITGLENPNSRDQLLAWAKTRGYPYDNLQKATVRDALAVAPDEDLAAALRLRQEIGKTSTSKFDKLLTATDPEDKRFRGGWQFYGASRTGRVAGRLLNPANLARPQIKHPEDMAQWMHLGDADLIRALEPGRSVLDTMSYCIRACLEAPRDE